MADENNPVEAQEEAKAPEQKLQATAETTNPQEFLENSKILLLKTL
jgi:hypothetical protein